MPGQSISESVVIFGTLSPLSSQSFELMGRPHFPPLVLCVHISLLSLSGGPQGPGGPNVVERGVGSGAGCGAPRERCEVTGHRCRGCSGQWDVSFTWEERSVSAKGALLGGVLRTGGAAAGTGVPVVMATAQCGPPPSCPPAPEARGSRRQRLMGRRGVREPSGPVAG